MSSHLSIPTLPYPDLRLPPRLAGLARLAYNLYWTWHPEVRALFARIDRQHWAGYRSTVGVLHGTLGLVGAARRHRLHGPLHRRSWSSSTPTWPTGAATGSRAITAPMLPGPVAYFCAEYGLHESLPIYSGGLGVLAGDHCKAASDMALPFIGVGLFYRRGYFRQTIDADGHQEHDYVQLDPERLPLRRVVDQLGEPLLVPVELPGRIVHAAVWLAQVGRVPLLLLDTDMPENDEADRPITHILYVRGREMRLHQELVLGVGGVRALRALGIAPVGLAPQRGPLGLHARRAGPRAHGRGHQPVGRLRAGPASAVFTIHTPVPAGNERFSADLVRRLAAPSLATAGLDLERILEVGRPVEGDSSQFDMTAFSLRNTCRSNGVSQLHAHTANETWSAVIERAHPGHHQRHPPADLGG